MLLLHVDVHLEGDAEHTLASWAFSPRQCSRLQALSEKVVHISGRAI